MKSQNVSESLYDADFSLWLDQQSAALRDGQFVRLDLPNLAEEIGELGRGEKRELRTRLRVLMIHLLKHEYQPQKATSSWAATIDAQRYGIELLLEDSPSLRSLVQRYVIGDYAKARSEAAKETGLPVSAFPEKNPFTPARLLGEDPDEESA